MFDIFAGLSQQERRH